MRELFISGKKGVNVIKSQGRDRVRRRFDGISRSYDDILHSYSFARRARFFESNSSGRCLEVGAGTGSISSLLGQPKVVFGTDLSVEMVRVMQMKGISGFQADAENLPVRNEVMDTIIGSEMIYYLDDPRQFFSEAYRILRPNGRLLLSSFNDRARVYDRLRTLLRKVGMKSMYFEDDVREFMTEKQLVSLTVSAGFRNIQIKKVIVLPWDKVDSFNRVLERTLFRHFGLFILLSADK